MGLLTDGTDVSPALPASQWSGPGESHVGYGEYNQRNMLSRWADYLERPAAPPPRTSLGVSGNGSGAVDGQAGTVTDEAGTAKAVRA
jgi:hypothetical protein